MAYQQPGFFGNFGFGQQQYGQKPGMFDWLTGGPAANAQRQANRQQQKMVQQQVCSQKCQVKAQQCQQSCGNAGFFSSLFRGGNKRGGTRKGGSGYRTASYDLAQSAPFNGSATAQPNAWTKGYGGGHKRSGHKRSGHKRSGHKRSGTKRRR
jgi:hypothetical protein